MPRYAVIDVGTNSVKFHVGEAAADGRWTTVVDRAEVTRLGEGLAAEARQAGVTAIAAVGTMGMRTARNSDAFIDEGARRSGVRVEVISGTEEGRLAYLAVKSGLGLADGSLVIFDTGGGSSQFTFGRGATVTEQFSVNVGAVRFTEQYGLGGVVSRAALQRATDAMAAELARLDGAQPPDALVGMGGAVTNLTAVMLALATYDPDAVQGARLSRAEVERQIELYSSRSTEARRQIVGLQPKRADVILAGACIVRTVMHKLQKDELTVSDRGLRHGVLLERFGGDAKTPAPE